MQTHTEIKPITLMRRFFAFLYFIYIRCEITYLFFTWILIPNGEDEKGIK